MAYSYRRGGSGHNRNAHNYNTRRTFNRTWFDRTTFNKACRFCLCRNSIPISGGPNQIQCRKCHKIMLFRAKCHCGITSYLSEQGKCCHQCRCRKCTKCEKSFSPSRNYMKNECPTCDINRRTKTCFGCKKTFIAKDNYSISQCVVCQLKKICKYCNDPFIAEYENSLSECTDCSYKIECLKDSDHHLTQYYNKVELVVEYDANYSKWFTCEICDQNHYSDDDNSDSDDSDDDDCKCKSIENSRAKTLVMPVPKSIKDEDIRHNNTISKHNSILVLLQAAGLLKGDSVDIKRVYVRERINKIKLE